MTSVKEVKELYQRLLRDREEMREKESQIDILQQNILHYIELENYSASEGSQLVKKLKEVRKARRKIKHEASELDCLYDRLKSAGIQDIAVTHNTGYALSLKEILEKKIPEVIENDF